MTQPSFANLTDRERVAFYEMGPTEIYSAKMGPGDPLYFADFYFEWDPLFNALQARSWMHALISSRLDLLLQT